MSVILLSSKYFEPDQLVAYPFSEVKTSEPQ